MPLAVQGAVCLLLCGAHGTCGKLRSQGNKLDELIERQLPPSCLAASWTHDRLTAATSRLCVGRTRLYIHTPTYTQSQRKVVNQARNREQKPLALHDLGVRLLRWRCQLRVGGGLLDLWLVLALMLYKVRIS